MLGLLPQVSLSTDSAILGTIIVLMAAGMLLGQHKVKTFALSVYVGIVLAAELGQPVFEFMKGKGVDLGLVKTRLVLLALPVIGLELGHNKQHRGQRRGMFLTSLLALATSALLIGTVISLFEPEARQQVLDTSTLASLFYGSRLWWLAVVPVIAVVESLVKPREH